MSSRAIKGKLFFLWIVIGVGFIERTLGQTIDISPTALGPFCAGEVFNLPFTITGAFEESNDYFAQLSNSSGNFTLPTPIGTLANTNSGGSISCIIPSSLTTSLSYAIRIISNNPSKISDTINNIAINALPTITFGGNPSVCIGSIMANLTYSSTTGSPSQFSIDYDETAEGQGFVDVPNTTLFPSPIVLTVPAGALSGTYNYTVKVTNLALGCVSLSISKKININALPITNPTPSETSGIVDNDGIICSNEAAVILSNAMPGSGTITAFKWKKDNVDISGATNFNLSNVTVEGNYTVIVTNSNGCSIESPPITIIVNAVPSASPSVTDTSGLSDDDGIICSNESAVLSANATAGSGSITGYQWRKNDVDQAGAMSSTFTVNETGTYTVVVTNSNGCSFESLSIPITVNNAPISIPTVDESSGLTDDDGIICSNESAVILSNATPGSGNFTAFKWKKDNIDINGAINSTLTDVMDAGNYTVIVTNSNGCSIESPTITITVNAVPAASPSVTDTSGLSDDDGIICSNESAVLSANATAGSGSITGYQWRKNDVDQAGAMSSTFTVNETGTYTVVVTDINGCSFESLSIPITVNNAPESIPTVDESSGLTDDDGIICSNESAVILANATPGSGSITAYQWRKDNVDQIDETNSTLTNVTDAGDYTVIVTDGNSCSIESPTITITVNAVPAASPLVTETSGLFEDDGIICSNESAVILANAIAGSGPIIAYQWRKDNVDQINETNSTLTNVTDEGDYTVIVTDGNSCSIESPTITITVNAVPAASPLVTETSGLFDDDGIICSNESAVILANAIAGSGPITAYQWRKDTVDQMNETNSTLTNVTDAGDYTVIVTDNNSCSIESPTITITVNPVPSGSAQPQTICSEQTTSVSLNPTNGTSFTWITGTIVGDIEGYEPDSGNIIEQTLTNPSNSTSGTVEYIVIPTSADGCYGASFNVTVTVNPIPTIPEATSPINVTVCDNQMGVYFSVVDSSQVSYQWSANSDSLIYLNPDTFNNNIFGFPGNLTNPTDYIISVMASFNLTGCANTAYFNVHVSDDTVPDPPKILMIDNVNKILGCFLNDSAGVTSYRWGANRVLDFKQVSLDESLGLHGDTIYQVYIFDPPDSFDCTNYYYWCEVTFENGCKTKGFYTDAFDDACSPHFTLTGINNLQPQSKKQAVSIAPNPNNGKFTLSIQVERNIKAQVIITDVTGKVQWLKAVSGIELQKGVEVDVSLPSGIYFVKIVSEDGESFTGKFIRQ
jgi:C4-type Zn-finger protein